MTGLEERLREKALKRLEADHDGTKDYESAEAVFAAHFSAQLSFHHAHRILTEKFEIDSEEALYAVAPNMGDE